MRVVTFSTKFPVKHPRAGEPTFFVEKVVKGLHRPGVKPFDVDMNTEMYHIVEPKFHTIRAGSRWKVGDKFSPRIWSGKPYASKQIQFAPDIEIKKIWTIIKNPNDLHGFAFHINGNRYVADWEMETANIMLKDLSKNDGLSKEDFVNWFPEYFTGQILCWNENVNY